MQLVTLPPPFHDGSVKTLHDFGYGTMAFRFTDRWSVFDVGPHHQAIPGKGKAVCDCAVQSFKIAASVGVPTHFLEQLDPVTIRVKKLEVITYRPLTQNDCNCVVPIEWIFRFRVAGSIDRAFRSNPGSSGYKDPRHYGFATSGPPAVGTPFPWPVHQFTTK